MIKLSKLYHLGKTGKIYSWEIWTENADIVTEYGEIDGKKQIARKTAVPKNIGKKNETSANEQAKLEAAAMHKFQLDRRYATSIEQAKLGVFFPMLAHDFKKQKLIEYPVDVQPKFDGLRCMAFWRNNDVVLLSRQGKEFVNCNHVVNTIKECIPKNTILDGELYVHGWSFQQINSRVAKLHDNSHLIQYHIYDVPDDELEWKDRLSNLMKLSSVVDDNILKIAPVHVNIKKEEQIKELESTFVEYGYEGAIVRLPGGLYEYGHRSRSLLKYKSFDDAEFKVVGFYEGEGRFKGCVTWKCVTDDGKEFSACPRGTLEDKQEWFKRANKYIGKLLTVRYFGLSDDGIPRFPVGVGFPIDK